MPRPSSTTVVLLSRLSTIHTFFAKPARALLFRDGFREKSHYAIYVYLKEKYSEKIEPKFLNELNLLRIERHEIFYGLEDESFDKISIKKQITVAEEFAKNMKETFDKYPHWKKSEDQERKIKQ